MTSSLVGSEMCIRDRAMGHHRESELKVPAVTTTRRAEAPALLIPHQQLVLGLHVPECRIGIQQPQHAG
eukprot:1526702-Prorocentrum_lima.AAC.1